MTEKPENPFADPEHPIDYNLTGKDIKPQELPDHNVSGDLESKVGSKVRDFLRNLRYDDRKNLIDVLKVMKKYKLDVVVRGSTVEAKANYNDIDLLIRGNTFNAYQSAAKEIEEKLGAEVEHADKELETGTYESAVVNYLTKINYKGTKIDMAFAKHGIDIVKNPPQVDLLVNEKDREWIENTTREAERMRLNKEFADYIKGTGVKLTLDDIPEAIKKYEELRKAQKPKGDIAP